ncbi:ATPase P [Weissella confusa]|uniref:ATPase P n=1 Tax=Weissella confusa TaxID=1583 RepID=UPI00107EF8F5|nr:ATPase P [Weissella confusa]MBJ7631128.1 ATPase P [Weissella confusa]MBJ7635329.1 ATPase P [Weissella confusa]TGE42259.1 ATPase P [Weissella confusa]TGE54450.1 ATPase P [Weissella confusa]
MLTLQLRYLRYAIVGVVLTVLTALIMPVLLGMSPFLDLSVPHRMMAAFAIATVFVIVVDVRMGMQAWRQRQEEGLTTLWVPIIGQTLWLATTAWIYKQPVAGDFLQTMTLPVMLAGLTILLLTFGLLQRRERAIPLDDVMKQATRRLTWLVVVLAIYALIFFGLTLNWQSGLTVATSVLLVVDPRWPAFWAGWRRFRILRALAMEGVTFQNPHALDEVRDVDHAIVEKSGLLTSDDVTVTSVMSLDDRYSDFDILGIVTGLVEPVNDVLSKNILTFAEERGVYPSSASEVELIPNAGIQGVILNEHFAVVSATFVLANDYTVDEDVLATYKELGNSVSYVVDSIQVVGVMTFGTSLSKAVLPIDRFFRERGITTYIATADTSGSVRQLTKLMGTLSEPMTDLTPEEKAAKQAELVNDGESMLITNQVVPEGVTPMLTVAVGKDDMIADVHVRTMTDLPKLWDTTDALLGADTKVLLWTSVVVLLIVLIAAGLGIFVTPWLFVAPIVATIIRLVLSLTLRAVVAPEN